MSDRKNRGHTLRAAGIRQGAGRFHARKNSRMSSFTTPLVVSPIDDRRWRLVESFEYHVGQYPSTDVVCVPAGYITDFASVPRPFWVLFPPWGTYGKAAVVHDWLCDRKDRPSREVHAIFNEAMQVLRVPGWKRWSMYRAVCWFGPRF